MDEVGLYSGQCGEILDRMLEGCQIIAHDWRYLYLNDAAARHARREKVELLGRRMTELYPGIEETPMFGKLAECMATRTAAKMTNEFVYPDGSSAWFELSFHPIPAGVFVMSLDITERRRVEEAREATIELLRICNRAGSLRALMGELTGYFQQLTGCEAVGVRLRDGDDFPYYETRGLPREFVLAENSLCEKDRAGSIALDPAGHPCLACMCGKIIRGFFDPAKPFFTAHGSFWSNCTTELLAETTEEDRQARTRNRCNGEGYESVALIPLRTQEETFGLFQFNDRRRGRFTSEKIALLEDLVSYVAIALAKLRSDTARKEGEEDRKRLEAQLSQVRKMEAVGLLAGGIAHDFNNMLQVIVSYASLLERNVEGDKLRDYVSGIQSSAAQAADLTRGLLAYSRKQVLDLAPTDINDIVRSVHKLLSRVIGEDIEILLKLAPGELAAVVDTSQFQQVLLNLAANARDAMPSGGRLTIATGLEDIDSARVEEEGTGTAGPHVRITVTDTGSGMDERTRSKIFEPFFTTKEMGKGTGLGLAIVYGIVAQHNGFIGCRSEKGRGASFIIHIPAVGPAAEKPVTAHGGRVAGGTETILLAEDDAQVREIIQLILETDGYRVKTATDGEAAVALYREVGAEVDLVLLDVIMPKKNGKEAYDEIRRLDPPARVCFISGYSHDILRDRTALKGDVTVIAKPILPNNLLQTIRAILDGD